MTHRPTDRRRTPEYERKRAALSGTLKLELDLIEERILSEGDHPDRRSGPDGRIYDFLSYRETGIAVSFLPAPDGNHLFLDFVIAQ